MATTPSCATALRALVRDYQIELAGATFGRRGWRLRVTDPKSGHHHLYVGTDIVKVVRRAFNGERGDE